MKGREQNNYDSCKIQLKHILCPFLGIKTAHWTMDSGSEPTHWSHLCRFPSSPFLIQSTDQRPWIHGYNAVKNWSSLLGNFQSINLYGLTSFLVWPTISSLGFLSHLEPKKACRFFFRVYYDPTSHLGRKCEAWYFLGDCYFQPTHVRGMILRPS